MAVHSKNSVSESLSVRTRFFILASMTAIYFFAYFQRVAVPGTIFDQLQHGFGISAAQVSMLAALYLYPYAFMQPFVGILVDKLGASRVLLTGGLLMCIGSILFPLSSSLAALYAGRVIVGLGSSLIYLSVVKEIDELFGPFARAAEVLFAGQG